LGELLEIPKKWRNVQIQSFALISSALSDLILWVFLNSASFLRVRLTLLLGEEGRVCEEVRKGVLTAQSLFK
jgi:hypothetical protein